MIADAGGLLGLFLGCSLLSTTEVVFFLFSVIISAYKNRKARQVNKVETAEEELKNLLMKQDENYRELYARIEKLKVLCMKKERTTTDGGQKLLLPKCPTPQGAKNINF